MIYVEPDPDLNPAIPSELVERAARAALDLSGAPTADLTVVLTGDERRYLGDIIISVQRAAAQAEARGHAVEAEVQLLVIHGVLHLLGHDHAEAEEKARMWAAQSEALERIGIPSSIVHE
jgi:rRNA maturation RNase YbeY